MIRRAVISPVAGAQLYAAPSRRHGRGVFAGRPFRKGELLERCPILCISAKDREVLERTELRSYLYERQRGAGAIALGLGSLYNHSADPNAECELEMDAQMLTLRASRDIAKGEEITISYGDESDLWFEPRGDRSRAPVNGAALPRHRSRGSRDTGT